MHSNCSLLPDHIVCKITQTKNIRRASTCDPALKLLNEEITSDIQDTYKPYGKNTWMHTGITGTPRTHILWKTMHDLSNRAPPPTPNTSITFSNILSTTPKHIANCFAKQFTNTVKHTRQIDTPTEPHSKYKI